MGFRLDYGKLIQMIHQSYLLEYQALFYIAQFGEMMIEVNGERKVYKFWNIQIHGVLEGGYCAKFHI